MRRTGRWSMISPGEELNDDVDDGGLVIGEDEDSDWPGGGRGKSRRQLSTSGV
jgi:hypothetical protein